jgi:2,3,4,5-tetrahydropyridine-2-carboxylate N-succinyltransferase
MTQPAFALGLGIGTRDSKGRWLEVFFPQPLTGVDPGVAEAVRPYSSADALSDDAASALVAALRDCGEHAAAELAGRLGDASRPMACVLLDSDAPPASVPEAYLKLHLISHRKVRPHGTNLEGLFALLPNVAWTNEGAVALEELPERQLAARLRGDILSVNSVDKFPRMTDYVVPAGVRIADTARVRLGAYLGEGTTVMHEGFVNFNAGTDGPGMIEGRISAGVRVGAHSDLGGGCSTMGTLSGGGNLVISVGERCLIGANAGIGIPLGDRCTVEAGLFVTAGTRVAVLDSEGECVDTVKARELAGRSDLLFRRHSSTGRVECLTNRAAVELNDMLHAHN